MGGFTGKNKVSGAGLKIVKYAKNYYKPAQETIYRKVLQQQNWEKGF
jgi:hypothetical protein